MLTSDFSKGHLVCILNLHAVVGQCVEIVVAGRHTEAKSYGSERYIFVFPIHYCLFLQSELQCERKLTRHG